VVEWGSFVCYNGALQYVRGGLGIGESQKFNLWGMWP
jgi:hypothetical protein